MTDTPNLSAIAMRTKAAAAMTPMLRSMISRGYAADLILALPIEADPAALVAEALRLPEIAALVAAANKALKDAVADEMDAWFAELKAALAALVQP